MSKFVSMGFIAAMAMLVVSAYAQAPAPAADDQGPPVLARQAVPARGGSSRLLVTSPAFSSGGQIDDRFTQNGDNMSPGLSWNRGPRGTQSFVIIAEDSSVNRREPIVHWILYNLPSTATSVPQNIPSDPTLENGAMQGKNITGGTGYIGPKPPAGETHAYHFQVFALNGRLNIDPANADRETILNAMRNRVLASGTLVGLYTGK